MCKIPIEYRYINKSWFLLALLLYCNIAFPQLHSENDTIIKIPPGVINKIKENISFFPKEVLLSTPYALIPLKVVFRDQNLVFFDSLKIKA